MTAKVKSVYEHLKYANADEMLIKARLVTEIADQVKLRRLTQTEASDSQPKLSNLLRGQFRGISEKKLMEYLTRLGRDIEIVVRPAPRSRRAGKITVVVT